MDGLTMENPIKMDDLGVPLFLETPIYICTPRKTRIHLPPIQKEAASGTTAAAAASPASCCCCRVGPLVKKTGAPNGNFPIKKGNDFIIHG